MSRFDSERLDELARRVIEALPAGMEEIGQDLRTNLKSVLGAALERLDLVTREEFDVQQAVLARTRDKLERLERTVAGLEEKLEASREE